MNTQVLGSFLALALGVSAWAATPLNISDGETLVIDDFADGDFKSNLGDWNFSNDNGDGGKSFVNASIIETTDVENNPINALKLEYSLAKGSLSYDPFVEASVTLSKDGSPVDLSRCTAIQYDYRSTGTRIPASFRVVSNLVADYGYHAVSPTYSVEWNDAQIKWSGLKQPSWSKIKVDIDEVKKSATAFSWQIQSNSGSGTLEIANLRCVNLPTYIVDFYHGETLMKSSEFLKGEMASYQGRYTFETEAYSYTITGWKPQLSEVTGNTSYKMVLDSSLRSFDIYFYDEEWNTLLRQRVEYGKTPIYVGLDPVKSSSPGYTYQFKGWGKYVCDEFCDDEYRDENGKCDNKESWYVNCRVEDTGLLPVSGEDSYFPVYDSTVIEYTVKFADYDGKILSEKKYPYGTKSSEIVKPTDPSRESNQGVDYTFEGWYPAISDVTGGVVYVAKYSSSGASMYTVAFMDGSEILQIGEVAYGETPEYKGEIPKKDPTVASVYTFLDWKDASSYYGVHETYSNTIYVPEFRESARKYWIVFLDDDGTVIDSLQYEYGSYPDEFDSQIRALKKKTYDDGFYFRGWTPEFVRVTGRAEYRAVYDYRVLFADDDGNRLSGNWYQKGEVPEYDNGDVEKRPTADYTYEFIGWDKEFAPVTDTVTYKALFAAIPVPKSPSIDITAGGSKIIEDFEDGDEISLLGGAWFAYDDSDVRDENGERVYHSEISKSVVSNGNGGKMLKVDYKRDCEEYDGWYDCDGWLGAGLPLVENASPVDLSQCNAIQYDYRGGAHHFRVESMLDERGLYFEKYFANSDEWTQATIYRSELSDGAVDVTAAFAHATQFIWNNMEGEGSLEIDNIKCLNKPSYIVKFYNGDELVDSASYAQGETPVYKGKKPVWSFVDGLGNEQYEYSFKGWSPTVVPVSGDAVYNAVIEKSLKTYEITFNVGYRETSVDVEYGKVPEYEGTPTKDADESCSNYVLDKWRSYDENYNYVYGLQPVTGRKKYYAEFTCTEPITYTITFLDDDGSVISSEEYQYGSNVPYLSPSKPSTAKYEYYFDDWTPSVVDYVDGDATYTARYESHIREYAVSFVDSDGNQLLVDGDSYVDYPYGTLYSALRVPTEVPEKTADENVQYIFDGWSPAISDKDSVTDYVTFVPSYKHKYAVRFVNANGESINVDGSEKQFYMEGTPLDQIALPETTPTRDAEGDVTFEFAGWLPTLTSENVVNGPMTIEATYKSSDNKYVVMFVDGDGTTVLERFEVAENETPVYNGTTPSKESNAQYTYTWDSEDGWDKPLTPVKGPVVYYAKFKETLNEYEVVFEKDDGTELSRKTYKYGATITEIPTKEQAVEGLTGQYKYSDEWCHLDDYNNLDCDDTGVKTVTGKATYVANIQYQVVFKNYDGDLWDDDTFRYMDDISWTKMIVRMNYPYRLQKPSDAKCDYTFDGWDHADVVHVTSPIDFIAQYKCNTRKYEVTFADEDGTILKAPVAYDYGTKPSDIVTPADPIKKPTDALTYSFDGWSLSEVTEDVTYTASYTSAPRKYEVVFVQEDGETMIGDAANYEYETAADKIVVPTAPNKAGFKFAGWIPEITSVKGPAKYAASYIANNQFVITWKNEDGTILEEEVYTEGDVPSYKHSDPKQESTAEYEYKFDKWTPSPVAVEGNATYTALYTATKRKYEVKFVNSDGSPLTSDTYDYGTLADNIVKPKSPEKAKTEYYVYTFVGWTPAVADVTGNVTYTAQYANKRRTYTVTFWEAEGVEFTTSTFYYNEKVEFPWWVPSKETDECYYDFEEWTRISGESDVVTSDGMEYMATYSSKCIAKSSSSSVVSSSSSEQSSSSSEVSSSSSEQSSSSSVVSSSSSEQSSSSSEVSSSSSEQSSSSSVVSSSSSEQSSSSSEVSSSSSEQSSSSSVKSSSSSAKSSSSSVKKSSSSSVKASSSSVKKSSSSSVKASSSSVKKSSSSSVKKSSSSSVKKSSSSSVKKSSSSSAKSKSSSSKKSSIEVVNVNNYLMLEYAHNTLTVSLTSPSKVNIEIFDMKGQLQERFTDYFAGSRGFDLSRLNRGNYIVRVKSRSEPKTIRIVIK